MTRGGRAGWVSISYLTLVRGVLLVFFCHPLAYLHNKRKGKMLQCKKISIHQITVNSSFFFFAGTPCHHDLLKLNYKTTKFYIAKYRKIPMISTGPIFVQKAFLLSSFSEELIFGGACYREEFCVSKWVWLFNKNS